MDLPKNELREYIQDNGKALWTAHNNHRIRYFNEDDIIKITNNYSTLIGKGAFGEVYRGVLDDNSSVAVKRYIHNVKEDFAKELIVHCEINHRNVVRLIGCCIGETALMMVTEYISKGNLSDILHCTEISISLETRLDIAIGCAEALSYMHSQMYGQVIHGDIKPANILLDENLNAKVSDFGISKLLSTDKTLYTTHVIGSIGYMDPLFARSGRLTSKSDVYSFGVVLLELITRRKAIGDNETISLTETFTQTVAKRKKMRELFDIKIAGVNNLRILEEIGKLAAKCLAMETDKRPEMKEVAERLRFLRKAQYKTQEKLTLFGWIWRSKQAPQDTIPGIDVVTDHVLTADAQVQKVHEAEGTQKRIIGIGSSKPIELEELLKASAEVLGKGKYGTTYKATLEDGSVFAVKRLKDLDVPEPVFKERIAAICDTKHELIVPLLGYYFHKDEQLLLYDYFGNRSLSSILHGKYMVPLPLDWETRSGIAFSAARVVAHIHSSNTKANHGNIKSSNIFLTRSYEPRVSEYGLKTLFSTPTSVTSNEISQKADVYDFGILLLELVTGKSPHHPLTSDEPNMLNWIMSVPQGHWAAQVLDQKLLKNNNVEEAMLQFLKVATDCCEESPNLRPVMSEVAKRIEEIQTSSTGDKHPTGSNA